jgi:hypothetical protein
MMRTLLRAQGRGVDMLSEVLQLQPLLADDLLSMSEAAATAAQVGPATLEGANTMPH